MKALRYLVICLLLFSVKNSFGQTQVSDVIITKKGEHINCSITRSDTARIYFKVGGNMSSIEVSLPLNEVSEVQYAPKQMPAISQPSAQTQRDDYVEVNTASVNPSTKKMDPPYRSNCLSFYGGLASPHGKFNGQPADTSSIGPGILGSVAQLSFTHRTRDGILVGLSCFYSINQLNTGPITEKYKLLTDSTWKAEKAVWRAFGIHLSVGYHKIFSDDLSLYVKANLGYVSLKYPELTVFLNSSQYYKYNTATSDAVSFGATLGLNYRLFQSLGAAIEVSYIQANCKYNEILVQGETPTGAGQPTKKISRTLREVKQTYSNVFISLGVNYWF
jgi:hypothetical protein